MLYACLHFRLSVYVSTQSQMTKKSVCASCPRVTAVILCRYVNGKSYMEDVADALEEAKEEIFITDWW